MKEVSKITKKKEKKKKGIKKKNSINLAIDILNWENIFIGKTIDEKIHLFNPTIFKIFINFIPKKRLKFDDSDPPWVNDKVKNLIKLKNEL